MTSLPVVVYGLCSWVLCCTMYPNRSVLFSSVTYPSLVATPYLPPPFCLINFNSANTSPMRCLQLFLIWPPHRDDGGGNGGVEVVNPACLWEARPSVHPSARSSVRRFLVMAKITVVEVGGTSNDQQQQPGSISPWQNVSFYRNMLLKRNTSF